MGKVLHGYARHRNGIKISHTYEIWSSMKARCQNPKHDAYHRYGGRGINVCERWMRFENFLADMGEAPEGLTLDRYPDNNGSYEPGNCRWATRSEQRQNSRTIRMITHDGETLCIQAWEKKLGLGAGTLWLRIKRGEQPPYAMRPAR